jgi:hypothetical protein
MLHECHVEASLAIQYQDQKLFRLMLHDFGNNSVSRYEIVYVNATHECYLVEASLAIQYQDLKLFM